MGDLMMTRTREITHHHAPLHFTMLPHAIAVLPQPLPMGAHAFNLMPPFRTRAGPDIFLGGIPVPAIPPVLSPDPEDPDDSRFGLKERNRFAAKKWRVKKDRLLGDLENESDSLRKQALDLMNEVQSLRVQNRLLEDELGFFQAFMSKMMAGPK
jgi:hypothetical protein